MGWLIFEVRPTDPNQKSSALSPETGILPRSSGDGISVSMRYDNGVSTARLRASQYHLMRSETAKLDNELIEVYGKMEVILMVLSGKPLQAGFDVEK